jgi:hypothetical protein
MTLIIQKPTGAKLNLRRTWQPMDPDAAAYITAVEAADTAAGQSGGLEEKTKIAIDNFVLGCKADGIWSAIKESCILAGARTRQGALVPLVGNAPTAFAFDDIDYGRKTGFVGNGTTKYLATNRLVSAEPINSNHVAIYASSLGNGIFWANPAVPRHDSSSIQARNLYFGGGGGAWHVQPSTAGLIGLSRTSTTVLNARTNGVSGLASHPTVVAIGAAESLWFFRSALGTYSTGRFAFYSMGESLNLALLDARVTDLINAIGAAF